MKKLIFFMSIIFSIQFHNAQKIFSVKYESRADLKVFVVELKKTCPKPVNITGDVPVRSNMQHLFLFPAVFKKGLKAQYSQKNGSQLNKPTQVRLRS